MTENEQKNIEREDSRREESTMKYFVKRLGDLALSGVIFYGIASMSFDLATCYKKIEERRYEQEQKYENSWRELFSDYNEGNSIYPYGLADTNGDQAIEFGEQVEAWRKMGFPNLIFLESEGKEQFPKPSLEQLTTAIEKYRSERRSE